MNHIARHSRHVRVSLENEHAVLTMVISEGLTLGSARREQQLRSHVLVCFRRLSSIRVFCDGRAVRAWLDKSRLAEMADLLICLDERIDEYLLAPLYPRVVEEILKITARERIRWTKDGRLETSGRGSFSCGPRSVHFPRYPVRRIEMLVEQVETIAAWRDADAGTAGAETCAEEQGSGR